MPVGPCLAASLTVEKRLPTFPHHTPHPAIDAHPRSTAHMVLSQQTRLHRVRPYLSPPLKPQPSGEQTDL